MYRGVYTTIATALLFLVCGWVSAQELTVYSNSTLSALEDVAVFNNKQNFSAITDQRGRVQLNGLDDGDTVTIQHPAYYIERFTVEELQKAAFKVYLIDKVVFLEEYVVAVHKNRERIEEVPNKVEVIYPSEIEFENPQTTAEMLENTGNVYVQKNHMGGGSPVIRGLEANKVLLVTDGVRMNNAIYRGGHQHNSTSIDQSILERTEVVFGPGSLIYGSDALGGVIHFYTKDPVLAGTDEKVNFDLNTHGRYATANHEKTGHIDFNIGLKKAGFLTSVTFSDFDDLRAGNVRNPFYRDFGKRERFQYSANTIDHKVQNEDFNIQRFTGYQQLNVLQKVKFAPNENVDVILNLQVSTTSNIPRYDKLTELVDSFAVIPLEKQVWADTMFGTQATVNDKRFTYARWDYGPQDHILSAVTLKLDKPTWYYDRLNLVGAYQLVHEERIKRRFESNIQQRQLEEVQVFSLNADLSKEINEKQFLQYGLELNYNDVRSTAVDINMLTSQKSGGLTRYPDGGNKMHSYSGYIKLNISPTPKVNIIPGFRYSNIILRSVFDTKYFDFDYKEIEVNTSAFSGSFGIVYNPGKSWNIQLLASSGYRVPNIDDIAKIYAPNLGEVMVPNPGLDPEYAYNVEGGLSKKFADRIKIDITAYNTVIKNAVIRSDFQVNNQDSVVFEGVKSKVISNINIGTAYIRGLSLNFRADLTTHFAMESSLNYTHGRNKTDEQPLAHIPPVYGRTGFLYQLNRFKSAFYVNYQGWKKTENYSPSGEDNLEEATEHGTPGWYTLNLMTSYQLHKHLRLQAGLENILDTHYRSFASGISGPGRNLIITARASF